MEPEDVRKKNMYLYEDKTHFGQPINLKLHELWDQCEAQSDLRQRKKAIAEFNAENRFRKRGISMIPTKFGISFTFTPLNQGSSLVNVYTDGTVLITHGTKRPHGTSVSAWNVNLNWVLLCFRRCRDGPGPAHQGHAGRSQRSWRRHEGAPARTHARVLCRAAVADRF
jgi:hypothetical protein